MNGRIHPNRRYCISVVHRGSTTCKNLHPPQRQFHRILWQTFTLFAVIPPFNLYIVLIHVSLIFHLFSLFNTVMITIFHPATYQKPHRLKPLHLRIHHCALPLRLAATCLFWDDSIEIAATLSIYFICFSNGCLPPWFWTAVKASLSTTTVR
jgi:hypothetical protein